MATDRRGAAAQSTEPTDHDSDPPELGRLYETRALWRIAGWGGAATAALVAAVLIMQTESGAQRLRLALAAPPDAPVRVVAKAEPAEAPPATATFAEIRKAEVQKLDPQRIETLRLEAQVRELAADRERLNERIAALEQNLNDMTGSIKRELTQATAAAAAAMAAMPALSAPQSVPTADPDASDNASSISVQTGLSTSSEPVESASNPNRSQAGFKSTIDMNPAPEARPPAAPSQVATPSQVTAPPGDAVPMPPVRVASAPTSDPAAALSRKPELGVDLGGARTLEILNMRWLAVKANFGPMLVGMHPLVTYDNRPNMIPYRLLVGPVPNGAAAAQICARMAASRVSCRSTRFVGEALAQLP